jgi:hypothetical protein
VALVERSAKIIWRAFPYFEWRYGARGRSFGRSDAGYLVTLLEHDESTSRGQVEWLSSVLACRGMPSLLLEYQLESLGRLWRRARSAAHNRFLTHASELRSARLRALDAPVFEACEALCRAAAGGVARRRGAGILIAAAVADGARGLGSHDEALVAWFSEAEAADSVWLAACASAQELAHRKCRRAGSGTR